MDMDITFKKKKLEKIFGSEEELRRRYGKINGRLIARRMMVLLHAPTLAHVPVEKPVRRHELKGSRKGEFAVDVEQPRRIVFTVNHNPMPIKEDGSIDLEHVRAITVIGVEDYHS